MTHITIPYGRGSLSADLPDRFSVEVIEPSRASGASAPSQHVRDALDSLLGSVSWSDFEGVQSAAIAINDKTRPVPHEYLLPPLLERLEVLGIPAEAITLIIATGTHPPMRVDEYAGVIPQRLLRRYNVACHDAGDESNLVLLGRTSRGTPIQINRTYLSAELRIVVGNIEPHQFQGFSGGVKSAAIGLAGRATIDHNHAMMVDPKAHLGHYEDNPARQDVEEIGERIGVHLALNAVLNERKEIVHVLAGHPRAVMDAGIPLARKICQVATTGVFDMVIASPGGYPKDINVYQSQKGLAHASLVTRNGGTIILVAACSEGSGSQRYERWIEACRSQEEVLRRFQHEPFHVGPHKAFQIAREMTRLNVYLVSDMPHELARKLLLRPIESLQRAVEHASSELSGDARIAVMPYANATIPAPGIRPGS